MLIFKLLFILIQVGYLALSIASMLSYEDPSVSKGILNSAKAFYILLPTLSLVLAILFTFFM